MILFRPSRRVFAPGTLPHTSLSSAGREKPHDGPERGISGGGSTPPEIVPAKNLSASLPQPHDSTRSPTLRYWLPQAVHGRVLIILRDEISTGIRSDAVASPGNTRARFTSASKHAACRMRMMWNARLALAHAGCGMLALPEFQTARTRSSSRCSQRTPVQNTNQNDQTIRRYRVDHDP